MTDATVERVGMPLEEFLRPGITFPEMTFIKPDADDRDWVKGSRIPDVLFISAERWEAYITAAPGWIDRPLALAPDLVVEIVSPTDLYSAVEAKVRAYLLDDVRLVWVFDLKTRSAKVYRQSSSAITQLESGDTLDGEDVIPGFKIAIADLFTK